MELPKKYKYDEIEPKWREFWKKHQVYKHDLSKKEQFSADTPPPYVSGKMHMGHALSYTQGDFIMRFWRMKGYGVFYPFGTDDNGLPTERYIEKLKKIDSKRMSREEFVKICSETVKELLPSLVQPWIDMGISADFDNAYSTIDQRSIAVSQKSFLDLYKKELVYRNEAPTVWCVKCQTAIAQAEFENIEKSSHFNDIAFHDEEGNELIISTTRPELIPACVGIFAHPEDERYKHLKDKKAVVPLYDYTVPVLFDEAVEKDKGTGLMMVCTFGDKEDIEKWYKYKLELRAAITKEGRMTPLAGKYADMKIKAAREAIIEDLKVQGFLKHQKEITHNTNVHERCGTEIEFIKTTQWFVDVLKHKDELVKVADDMHWYPAHMKTRYVHWVENLNWDWCISRQRHFGVPFPVWYEKDTGNVVVPEVSDLPVDPITQTPKSYKGDPNNLEPEMDVMDTWATSSVSPHVALEWQKEGELFKKLYPMSLRMQSHDIIRTWLFYTVVKSWYHHKQVPWKHIMISGFVQDKHGKKMSKSKGNTIDPVGLMEKYGADTLRFTASSVKLGEDMPFHDKYLETGKKIVTKLFNAAKFVHMHLEDYQDHEFKYDELETIDKWLIDSLNMTVSEVGTHLENFEFAKARASIEHFFWHHLCDQYLEIVKDRLYKPDIYGEKSRLIGQMTLYETLLTVLKLFAPYVPYITEEIYQWKFASHEDAVSIHSCTWPEFYEARVNQAAELSGGLAINLISAVRKFKSSNEKSQKHGVEKLFIATDVENQKALSEVLDAIKMTVNAKHIEFVETASVSVEDGLSIDVELAEE